MHKYKQVIIVISVLLLPQISLAAESIQPWQQWLLTQVQQHPDLIAAQSNLDSTLALAEANNQPLYNPELETDYERNDDDNNFTIGLSQTIDLWDKRGTRQQQANHQRTAAQFRYHQALQTKLAEALQTIVEYQTSKDLAGFAQSQEKQLDTLLCLLRKRQQAGDIGQLDMELAFFNLSQRLGATAEARARLRQAEAKLDEIIPDWSAEKVHIPQTFWQIKAHNLTTSELEQLPAVARAKAEYQIMEQDANLARLAGKAEPTLGIRGGEDGGKSLVGVSLSIPLNIRNNYGAESRAAGLQSQAAKSSYRAIKRQYHFDSQAALATYQEYQIYFNRWQKLIAGRGDSSEQLLQKQWDSGDMSTASYLQSLEQRRDGMAAGIDLRSQFQLACIDWLHISGQLIQPAHNSGNIE